MLTRVPEPAPHFIRVDRDDRAGGRHYVVHAADPRLVLELAPGRAGEPGEIRRVAVPNSWAGDYGRYLRLIAQAQEFYARTAGGATPR